MRSTVRGVQGARLCKKTKTASAYWCPLAANEIRLWELLGGKSAKTSSPPRTPDVRHGSGDEVKWKVEYFLCVADGHPADRATQVILPVPACRPAPARAIQTETAPPHGRPRSWLPACPGRADRRRRRNRSCRATSAFRR